MTDKLYRYNGTELNQKDENLYYDIPVSYTTTEIWHDATSSGTYHQAQGFCTDGTYLYALVCNDSNSSDASTYTLTKMQTDGTVITSVNNLVLGHGNDICYDPTTNQLYCVYTLSTEYNTVIRIDADTLTNAGSFNLRPVLIAGGCASNSSGTVSSIEYLEEYDMFALHGLYESTEYIAIITRDSDDLFSASSTVKTVLRFGGFQYDNSGTRMLGQGLSYKDGVFYQVYYPSAMVMLDWQGNIIKRIFTLTPGEYEGIAFVDDDTYFLIKQSSVYQKVVKAIPTTESISKINTMLKLNVHELPSAS